MRICWFCGNAVSEGREIREKNIWRWACLPCAFEMEARRKKG